MIDPLFSTVSSPVLFSPKAFDGTDIYKSENMPNVDYIIITHDHWDHLDYEAMKKLKDKTQHVICLLGVGASLARWGFHDDKIIEMDWWNEKKCDSGLSIHCLPARHFSGRGFLRNKTLWASFLIHTSEFKIYISGDSGYGDHFSKIEEKFGPMDLVTLDSGQHDLGWRYIHMQTNEVIKAAKDLKAKIFIPSHICKLALANHAWNEPLNELSQMVEDEKISMIVPMIGEKINLRNVKLQNPNWWKWIK